MDSKALVNTGLHVEPGATVLASSYYSERTDRTTRWLEIGNAVTVYLPSSPDAAAAFLASLIEAATATHGEIVGPLTLSAPQAA